MSAARPVSSHNSSLTLHSLILMPSPRRRRRPQPSPLYVPSPLDSHSARIPSPGISMHVPCTLYVPSPLDVPSPLVVPLPCDSHSARIPSPGISMHVRSVPWVDGPMGGTTHARRSPSVRHGPRQPHPQCWCARVATCRVYTLYAIRHYRNYVFSAHVRNGETIRSQEICRNR